MARGGHAWWGHAWLGGLHGRGHAWQAACMVGACTAREGVYGKGGCAWQGRVCIAGGNACRRDGH